MPSYFPCPNPACTYQFDAEQLPAAAMVTCPVCRTRFPYRAAAAPAPVAAEQDEGDDWNTPSRPGQQTAQRERTNRLINPLAMPKNNKTQTALMLLGFTLVVITILIVVMMSMRKSWFKKEELGENYVDENFNFRFVRFETKWQEDTALRKNIFNGFLQKLRDEEVWIGLRCIYLGGGTGVRGPGDGEMEAQINKVLTTFTAVQREPIKAKIGGKELDGYKFTGQLNDAEVFGEIHAFSNKGIGYVLTIFAAADTWDGRRPDLVKLRDSFEFASGRDKWTEARTATAVHFVDGGDYQIEDRSYGLWERATPEDVPMDDGPKKPSPKRGTYIRNATDEDEKATMVLRCMDPKTKLAARKDYLADAMILVLPSSVQTMEDLRKYVHDSLIRKEEGRKVDFIFEAMQKQPFESPAVPSTIGTFRVTNSLDRTHKRYYAMNLLKIGDHTVAVVGWCPEKYSDLMGPYIVSLVQSLKAR